MCATPCYYPLGISEVYTRYSLKVNEFAVPRCRLWSWWQFPETNALRQSLYGEKEGAHATPSEVAMVQYAFPEHIKDVSLGTWHPESLEYLRNHAEDDHFEASDHRSRHPDGRIGSDPSLANQKTVNACWKQPPGNFWKTIRGSSKRCELLKKKTAALPHIYSV